jgi:ATP-dependent exoDNAse (exonuclease V) beta subunit
MSASPDLQRTQATQWEASDPAASAWVVANAGSGKTHVLTQRVIRLLLSGADPAAILCLTFTKVAAAEMARRIFGRLGSWTSLPDPQLSAEIAALQGSAPSASQLMQARRLFARALETPGGLKIQTVHAFCEKLLHQFPFEANVPGQFAILDDTAAAALIAGARAQVMAAAAADLEVQAGRMPCVTWRSTRATAEIGKAARLSPRRARADPPLDRRIRADGGQVRGRCAGRSAPAAGLAERETQRRLRESAGGALGRTDCTPFAEA